MGFKTGRVLHVILRVHLSCFLFFFRNAGWELSFYCSCRWLFIWPGFLGGWLFWPYFFIIWKRHYYNCIAGLVMLSYIKRSVDTELNFLWFQTLYIYVVWRCAACFVLFCFVFCFKGRSFICWWWCHHNFLLWLWSLSVHSSSPHLKYSEICVSLIFCSFGLML